MNTFTFIRNEGDDMYTRNPTLKNTLPHEGLFRLNAPLQCNDGVFDTGSVVQILNAIFDESRHYVEYGVCGTNGSKMIYDIFRFTGSPDEWNRLFTPVEDSSEYYDNMKLFDIKKGTVVHQQNTVDLLVLFSFFPGLLFLIIPFVMYVSDLPHAPSLTAVIISMLASAGFMISTFVGAHKLEKKFDAICDDEKQYELGYFLAKQSK